MRITVFIITIILSLTEVGMTKTIIKEEMLSKEEIQCLSKAWEENQLALKKLNDLKHSVAEKHGIGCSLTPEYYIGYDFSGRKIIQYKQTADKNGLTIWNNKIYLPNPFISD